GVAATAFQVVVPLRVQVPVHRYAQPQDAQVTVHGQRPHVAGVVVAQGGGGVGQGEAPQLPGLGLDGRDEAAVGVNLRVHFPVRQRRDAQEDRRAVRRQVVVRQRQAQVS